MQRRQQPGGLGTPPPTGAQVLPSVRGVERQTLPEGNSRLSFSRPPATSFREKRRLQECQGSWKSPCLTRCQFRVLGKTRRRRRPGLGMRNGARKPTMGEPSPPGGREGGVFPFRTMRATESRGERENGSGGRAMNNTSGSPQRHYFSSNQDHDAFYKLTTFPRHLPY